MKLLQKRKKNQNKNENIEQNVHFLFVENAVFPFSSVPVPDAMFNVQYFFLSFELNSTKKKVTTHIPFHSDEIQTIDPFKVQQTKFTNDIEHVLEAKLNVLWNRIWRFSNFIDH